MQALAPPPMQVESGEVHRSPVWAPFGHASGAAFGFPGHMYEPPTQAQAPPRLGNKQPIALAEARGAKTYFGTADHLAENTVAT